MIGDSYTFPIGRLKKECPLNLHQDMELLSSILLLTVSEDPLLLHNIPVFKEYLPFFCHFNNGIYGEGMIDRGQKLHNLLRQIDSLYICTEVQII